MSRGRPAKRYRARTYRRKSRSYKRYVPRRYGRKYRIYGRKMNFKNGILNNSRIMKCPWVTAGVESFPTLGATNIFVPFTDGDIKINSIYDPWAKLGGNSASWYTFLSKMYHTYEVVGAKAVFTFRQYNTQTTGSGTYNIWPTYKFGVKSSTEPTLATVNPSWTDYVSDPNCSMKSMHLNSMGTGKCSIVVYFNPSKWFDRDKREDNTAFFGSDPTNVIYLLPWFMKEDYIGQQLGLTFQFEYSIKILFVVRVTHPYDMQEIPSDMEIKQDDI